MSFGGYDVFPFILKDDIASAMKFIKEKIELSNKASPKYYSSQFVIQKGVEEIFLTPDNRKFDLRTYGLIVWENEVFSFYYFKYMLMRKSSMQYNPDSEESSVQLTNTTQTTIDKSDLYGITELIGSDYSWYSDIYPKTMQTFNDICKYISSLPRESLPVKGYHLIGLDFIPCENGVVYLLEINKHPSIYYDEKRMIGLHHNMESKLFTESYFTTILETGNIHLVPDNFVAV